MSDNFFNYTVNILLKPVCFAFIDITSVMKIMKCQEEEIFISKKFFFLQYE